MCLAAPGVSPLPKGAWAGDAALPATRPSEVHSLQLNPLGLLSACVTPSVPSPPPLPPVRGRRTSREAHGGRGAWLWPRLARSACSGGEEWNAVRGGESSPRHELGRGARDTIAEFERPRRSRKKRGVETGRAPFRRRCASLAAAEGPASAKVAGASPLRLSPSAPPRARSPVPSGPGPGAE